MSKEIISFDELDKIIDRHKDDKKQKGAFLILKSTCEPFRETGIPKQVATRVINHVKSQQETLALTFEDNEDMADFLIEKADKLGNVIQVCFPEE